MTTFLVADAQLRVVGLAPTAQRRAVLALLAGRSRPLTAQQVHAELTSTVRHIGLTTVYRALHSLADAGLLHTFDLDGQRAYRHCGTAPHQHLICTGCETVTECPPEVVTSWLTELHQHTGFTPHPDRLDLRGICATCAKRDHGCRGAARATSRPRHAAEPRWPQASLGT